MSETAWVITDDDIDWAERRINLTEVIARDAGAVRWPILLKWLLSSPRKRGVLAFTSGAERSVADCFDVLADDLLSRATSSAPAEPETLDPCKPHKMRGLPLKVLAFASYCGSDNPGCSEEQPCHRCLLESNVFLLSEATGQYVGELQNQKPAAPQPASADAGETEAVITGPEFTLRGKHVGWCGVTGDGRKASLVEFVSWPHVDGSNEEAARFRDDRGEQWAVSLDGRYGHESSRCDITGDWVEPPPPTLADTVRDYIEDMEWLDRFVKNPKFAAMREALNAEAAKS